jgi:DNA polymerase-3 subunit epsilon
LLGLEEGPGSCFGLQVGRCNGACIGKEPARLHLARVKLGLMTQRLKPWPHQGPVMFREGAGTRQQWHVVDAWQHLATFDADDDEAIASFKPRSPRVAGHFDIDAYRLFTRFMRDSRQRPTPLPRI